MNTHTAWETRIQCCRKGGHMSMQPLVGRDREIRVLDDVLDHINERGGALVVRGEAGIGKSSLLAIARRR
jgi:ABC-type transport system involved in cytochrome c biogenesis ATPase subunit